jgi:phosphatidate phosphatase APP1
MHGNSRFAAIAVPRTAVAAVLLLPLFAGCAFFNVVEGPAHGEEVLFFPSLASVSSDNRWRLTIQGRVFEPAEGSRGRQALIDSLAPLIGASPTDALFRARAGSFVSDSSRNTRVSVQIGDHIIPLAASDPAGYFTADIALTDDEVVRLAKDGKIAFQSVPTAGNPQRFPGNVVLVPDKGVTVITDMDDTIKVTDILNHTEKVANTFLRPFRAVPGMPDMYRSWREALGPGIHFHVVSAGPWQFNEPLRRFTEQAGFPVFTWDMRSVDIGDVQVLLRELNPPPNALYDFKVEKIRAFMTRFPNRHVVLVGDSGEKDPEVYATILSEFAERVDAVFIRNVSREDQKARYERLFPGKEARVKLKVFQDPKELPPPTAR